MTPLLLTLLLHAPLPPPTADADHRYDTFITAAVTATADVFPVPPNLVRAIIKQESAFRPDAVSQCGALGLMQVMPFNAAKLGLTVADLRDPEKNILAGVRLLAVLLRHYRGDVISALVGYNARPRAPGAPLPRNGETPDYVKRVLAHFRDYERQEGRDLPQPPPRTVARKNPASPLSPSRSIRLTAD